MAHQGIIIYNNQQLNHSLYAVVNKYQVKN